MKTFLPIAALLLLAACGAPPPADADREQHSLIDERVEQVAKSRVPDSLEALIDTYTVADNLYGLVVAYKALGKLQRESAQFETAIATHLKGLSYARRIGDICEEVRALNNIGTNYRRLGLLSAASDYHYQALELTEQHLDSSFTMRKNRLISLNGIGNIQLTLGNNDEAVKTFRLALAGESELGSDLGMAINYANIGAIYETKQLYDSAYLYYVQSLEHNIKASSNLGISLCNNHLGRIHEIRGEIPQAIERYRYAYRLMEHKVDRWHWLESCLSLARVYLLEGKSAEAKPYLDRALATATRISSLEHLAEANRLYYLYYHAQGRWQQALRSYRQSTAYADSVYSKENFIHFQNQRIAYETEKKQIEISALQAKQRFTRIISIAVGTLLALLVVAIFFAWRFAVQKRHKAELQIKQLEQEKQLIATQAVLDGETAERTRLASDLHDGLGGMLSAVKLTLMSVKQPMLVEAADTQTFSRAVELLEEAIRELRRVAHNMMPESLSRCGLQVALSDFCDSVPNAEFAWYGPTTRLNSKIEVMVYRVVGELVNNAMKHARAKHIAVQVIQDADRIAFTVEDDGCGFDPDAQHRGAGLTNIRTRVAAYGGNIAFSSKPNEGTEVNVELKLVNSE